MFRNDELEPRDFRVLAEFRYEIRRFLHFSEEAARAAGVEPRQHQLLLAVKGLPDGREPTVGELAERLQLQHHSADELIARAEERGLVRRQRPESDRRRRYVTLTPEGERLLRDLTLSHRAELRAAAPALRRALAALAGEPNNQTSGATENAHEERAPASAR